MYRPSGHHRGAFSFSGVKVSWLRCEPSHFTLQMSVFRRSASTSVLVTVYRTHSPSGDICGSADVHESKLIVHGDRPALERLGVQGQDEEHGYDCTHGISPVKKGTPAGVPPNQPQKLKRNPSST